MLMFMKYIYYYIFRNKFFYLVVYGSFKKNFKSEIVYEYD